MRHSFRPVSLSVSSEASVSSATSLLSPSPLSPRRVASGHSPPPSPSLPSLIPRHGKKKPAATYRSLRRILLIFGACAILAWLGIVYVNSTDIRPPFSSSPDYEIISDDALPKYPSAVIVTDHRGHNRWTVSIPQHNPFPLRPAQYREVCEQSDHIGTGLEMRGANKRKSSYYARDPSFMDVGEAVAKGLLPAVEQRSSDEGIRGLSRSGSAGEIEQQEVCEKSLTYVMETGNAGMGNTLMGLWLAYGLAQKEGRAFFVDDTRWLYGNYTSYFKPPPLPLCAPAPANQRLPCPHSVDHLVVSSATFRWTFGDEFQDEFVDRHKSAQKQQHRIFSLLRVGYEALFHLADELDQQFVTERTSKEFRKAHAGGGTNIGLHVRRGDVHPWEYEFAGDYLPLTRYMDEVREILITKYEHDDEHGEDKSSAHSSELDEEGHQHDLLVMLNKRHGAPGIMASQLFLGSDDPDVYTAPEASLALRAQDRIVLASKLVLEREALKTGGRKNHWIDSIHGWEGGFYHDQFFGLGMPETGTPPPPGPVKHSLLHHGHSHTHLAAHKPLEPSYVSGPDRDGSSNDDIAVYQPPESAMALRQLVGRAYLLDLAVLAQTDTVVCAVSAAACRILAVMMGWEKAFTNSGWRNVDGGYGWRGLVLDG